MKDTRVTKGLGFYEHVILSEAKNRDSRNLL